MRGGLRRKDHPTDAFLMNCFLCGSRFQFGPHIYDGRPQWEDVMVCIPCIRGNWDGVVLASHPRLGEHLKAKGIPIKLNAKGWLDLPNPVPR
jgi:hypothetical protein